MTEDAGITTDPAEAVETPLAPPGTSIPWELHEVYKVSATTEPGVYLIEYRLTDMAADTYDAVTVSRPDDPHGINPQIRQWLIDNEGSYMIEPYVPPAVTEAQVDAERDRRIAAGLVYEGVLYQTRPADRENIAGASTAALAAIMNGAQPGDLRWHGGASDFAWIAADNTTHTMDAQTVFGFGQAAMQHKTEHIFAARALKNLDPIPLDYADDAYWP